MADMAVQSVQPSEGPELVQLLTPEGERVEHPDYSLDLDTEAYRGLYRDLVLVRRIDTEATALQRQGELGIWASLLGQEAAQVGSGRALQPDDFAFPTYREHGVAWCRGVDPLWLLGLFRGVNHGGWDPGGAGPRPGGLRTHADRGVHLPDGRAHHLRRPDPLPAGQRAGELEAEGPDRAAQGVPGPHRAGRPRVPRRGRGRGRGAGRA